MNDSAKLVCFQAEIAQNQQVRLRQIAKKLASSAVGLETLQSLDNNEFQFLQSALLSKLAANQSKNQ